MPTPYDYKTWSNRDYFTYKQEVECYRKISKRVQGFDKFSEDEVERYTKLTKKLDEEIIKFERTKGKDLASLAIEEPQEQEKQPLTVGSVSLNSKASVSKKSTPAFVKVQEVSEGGNNLKLAGITKESEASSQNNTPNESITQKRPNFFTFKFSK